MPLAPTGKQPPLLRLLYMHAEDELKGDTSYLKADRNTLYASQTPEILDVPAVFLT